MRRFLGGVGAALASVLTAPVARAAEWERIEADLVAVAGSPDAALSMAQCAVEAARAGVESPEQMAALIRRAYVGANDLARIRHRLQLLVNDIEDMEGL